MLVFFINSDRDPLLQCPFFPHVPMNERHLKIGVVGLPNIFYLILYRQQLFWFTGKAKFTALMIIMIILNL